VNHRIARATRLRDRLEAVLGRFDATGSPSADVLVTLIEEMTAMEIEEFEQMAAHRQAMVAKLSPQELEELAARQRAMRESLTPEQLAALERSRPPLPH
jgi:hypothetical protein